MIRSLKAIGNAGHLSSIKTLMKFLPGVSPTVVSISTRAQRAAVQALRHLAARDVHRVSRPKPEQHILQNLFCNSCRFIKKTFYFNIIWLFCQHFIQANCLVQNLLKWLRLSSKPQQCDMNFQYFQFNIK